MSGAVSGLLGTISAPAAEGVFNVVQVPGHSAYYAGRAASGSAAMLVKATGPGRAVPLQLAGIEAHFGMPCRVSEVDGAERTETLTAIVCVSRIPTIEAYFASIMDALVTALGDAPTLAGVAEAVDRLVELFQKLRRPPRKPLVGLVGELMVIRAAQDPAAAVRAWRGDPDERYDFAAGSLRLEAKAASGRRRLHALSFEQANPPAGSMGVLASVLVEPSAGGISLGELLGEIEAGLSEHAAVLKLRTVVADTLGQDLPAALGWRFDLHHARSSLALFDLRSIPAIRGPLPAGVSSVRFTADLDSCAPMGRASLAAVDSSSRVMLPA